MTTKPMSIFDVNKVTNQFSHYGDRIIYCGNCGEKGHMYRDCKYPVISLGIILFDYNRTTDEIKYLLVRRKDSIGYVEFLRGKYATQDSDYILKIFEEMTVTELDKLQTVDFETLWKNLWMEDKFKIKKRSFNNDYESAFSKFKSVKQGYKNGSNKIINLSKLVSETKSKWKETEWGIPKGRRNLRESDIDAAIREFKEETNILDDNFMVLSNVPTFIEEYVGSDNIKYRHIYYLAKLIGRSPKIKIDINNKSQVTEISSINWFNLQESHIRIRSYHIEKKKVLSNVDLYIREHKLYNMNLSYFTESKSNFYNPCVNQSTYSKSL